MTVLEFQSRASGARRRGPRGAGAGKAGAGGRRELRREIDRRSRTLWERLAEAPPAELPPQLEGRLLTPWARVVAGGRAAALARRLAWDGIEPRRAAAALLPDWNRAGSPSTWTAELLHYARDCRRRAVVAAGEPGAALAAAGRTPFAELWLPWVERTAARLAAAAGPALEALAPPARADLESTLLDEIAELSAGAAYELLDARRRTAGADGSYRAFVDGVLDDPLGGLYRHYPVLARQTVRAAGQWVERSAELARRLAADRAEIGARLGGGGDPGPAVEVTPGLSDRHDGGRQVLRLRFADGLEVYYKPRGVGAEAAFGELLAWCREASLADAPPAVTVLPRTGYGWMAAAVPAELAGAEAVRSYHRSAGTLAALAHALRAEDLHAENLVATAAGPAVVDAENLLQPERAAWRSETEPEGEAADDAGSCLATALFTALLPGGGEDRGLGGLRGASRRRARLVWEGLGSDRIVRRVEHETVPPAANVPRLAGAAVDAGEHAGEVAAGFAAGYRFLLARREELLAADGPLAGFAGVAVRVLFRPSQEYGRALQLAAAPRNQRSGLAGSWLAEALLAAVVEAGDAEPPAFWPLAADERAALEAGDVPRFTIDAEATAVPCRTGLVEGLFVRSGLDAVRRRIAGLGEADLARQIGRIHRALAPEPGPCALARAVAALEAGAGAAERFRAAADALAIELATEATGAPLPDLAAGPLGVALFLAAAARTGTGGPAAATALGRLLDRLPARYRSGGTTIDDLPAGGFSGLGSLLWGLVWLTRLTGDRRPLAVAEALAGRLDQPRGGAFDVERGAAGALLGLLALAAETGADAPLAAARRWGEALLAGQRPTGSATAAWPGSTGIAETGFAHGAAGAARALAALAAATGEPRFLVGAAAAIGHERARYDAERRNWPVILTGPGGRRRRAWMVAWCRGAPGIALSRLYWPPELADPALAAEREVALDTTAEAPLSELDHLCCGNLGRSSVLLTAAQRTGDGGRRKAAERLAGAVLERAAATGRLALGADLHSGPAPPVGLLQGRAGAGYQLVRLIAPELPDALALELPGERLAAEGR